MKKSFFAILAVSGAMTLMGQQPIRDGAYYGTNYTVPFAHAYRALGELGVDRKEAIDRDVYHMARLGLNAFRLHLWDVELSNATGDLLANEHLDLLDYLIASLEKRGIAIVLTAQTNFGNGYPERNTDPNGAYSYDYEKCKVHDTESAIQAQERYVKGLVGHLNPYTGRTYGDDPSILAIEINNEPCHSGAHDEVKAYVERMARALKEAGWKKEILYNVSHNMHVTEAFYEAEGIDGTTYQWYPTGLVKGSRRRGNFLPVLDSYDIPFDTIKGFGDKSRVIYEYDPADVLDTYLYPAAARTFRKAGFNWITQFAYDPIDMARFNTEYQTHFLNLAYTPGKAIGMMIAAEATRQIAPDTDFGSYPADTVFGDFTVSARRNLALLNDGTHYYNTNTSDVQPKDRRKLRAVAGCGSSPIVKTDGTGAYFIDRLEKGVWRLEIMPDVVLTADPFEKPSLKKTVGEIIYAPVEMGVFLPDMPKNFSYRKLGEAKSHIAEGSYASLEPGVYILGDDKGKWTADMAYGDGAKRVGEYVAPYADKGFVRLVHTPAARINRGDSLVIKATVAADHAVDSVVVYPATANFWNDHNRLFKMEKTGKYEFTAVIGPDNFEKDCDFRYCIVVFDDNGRAVTYPQGTDGTPLDWDFTGKPGHYVTHVGAPGEAVILLRADAGTDGAELSTIPEAWSGISLTAIDNFPGPRAISLSKGADAATELCVISKYVGDIMESLRGSASRQGHIKIKLGKTEGLDSVKVGLVDRDGFTRSATAAVSAGGVIDIAPDELRLDETLLTPAPYPVFLKRRFKPEGTEAGPLRLDEVETLTIVAEAPPHPTRLDIEAVWIEP